MCVCVCVCEKERECVCVCVCERGGGDLRKVGGSLWLLQVEGQEFLLTEHQHSLTSLGLLICGGHSSSHSNLVL